MLVDMSGEEKDEMRDEFMEEMAKEIYPNFEPSVAYMKLVSDRDNYKMCYDLYYKLKNEDEASKAKYTSKKLFVHCPGCGFGFTHELLSNGKSLGGIGGASAGAILGAKVGIAMGPLGAIAGTIPGAILGGLFGNNLGNNYDKPRCPNCGTKFEIPNSLK